MGLLGFLGGNKGGGTPKWAKKRLLDMNDRAEEVSNIPFTPYEETRVAPVNSTITDAIGRITAAPSAGSGAINAAIDMAKRTAAYQPGQVAASSVGAPTVTATMADAARVAPVQGIFGATVAPVADVTGVDRSAVSRVNATGLLDYNIDDYMNPYLRNVADSVMADLAFQREQQRGADNARAVKAGAFGGSRQAVVDAETNDMFSRTLGSTVSDLYRSGYDTATGLIMRDADRGMEADRINQGSDVSLLGMDQQAKALNQDAAMKAALANAGYSQDAAKTNQGILMQAALADAGYAQQTGLANQASSNAASTTNAGAALEAARLNQAAGLEAAKANQAAGLTANDQAVRSSGLLGDFGASQSKTALDAGIAGVQAGAVQQDIEQAKLDADYMEFLRKVGYPMEQLAALQSGTAQLMGTTAKPQTGLFDTMNQGMKVAGTAMKMFAACWVAREVYGTDGLEWRQFRAWLITKAPRWLFRLYIRHGESFAGYIADKPRLKAVIRFFMDKVR